jgi:hypothetical protein
MWRMDIPSVVACWGAMVRHAFLSVSLILGALSAAAPEVTTWRFDSTQSIGGHKTTVLGHPKVVNGAIEFNGVDDALFVDVHPLAGAAAFTWEVIFRPDLGGKPEQRFFHLQERGTDNRMLFEIRVIGDQWCLDSFAMSPSGSKALMDRAKLHPLGNWYAVAAVYDGRWYRNYVNGVEQNAAEVKLTPQGEGQTSIGVRINRVDYYKGAIRLARMTRRALPISEFLKP